MPISLAHLKPAPGSRTHSKRLGRGSGSGKGNYSTKGIKGQRARTGGRRGLRRKGLKMIFQRIPKLGGFRSIHPRSAIVSVGALARIFPAGTEITPKLLRSRNLVREIRHGVKVLGDGEVTKAFTLKGFAVSASAKEKIEKAGGTVVIAGSSKKSNLATKQLATKLSGQVA